jgi:hypothetical protein
VIRTGTASGQHLSPESKLNDKAELEEPMARKAKVKVRPASKVAGKANRWQYETISISRTTEIAALNAMLNGLGERGWEFGISDTRRRRYISYIQTRGRLVRFFITPSAG